MAAVEKFLFTTDFDKPVARPSAQAPQAPPAPTFSETEVEDAKRTAFADGEEQGRARATEERESAIAGALTQIESELAKLAQTLDGAVTQVERQAIEAAVTLVRKLLPGLARERDLAEIEALIDTCLKSLVDEPRVVIRVPDALLDALKERVGPLAERSGYSGRLVLVVDRSLGDTDCRVEWADGGAERDTAHIWAEAEKALARFVAATGGEKEQSAAEDGDTN